MLKRSDNLDEDRPPFGKTRVEIDSPNIVDNTVIEEVAERPENYRPLPYGTPHPDNATTGLNLVLVWQGPVKAANNQVRVIRVYSTGQDTNADWYNYAEKYSEEDLSAPIFIRSYELLRSTYAPLPKGEPLTAIIGLAVTAGGTGYTSDPTVTINGGGGTGATANPIRDITSGVIVGLELTAPGSGYTSTPTVSITGGGGSGATATAAIQPQNAYLVREEMARLDDSNKHSSLFVRVMRVYETLPGPWVETTQVDEDGFVLTLRKRRNLTANIVTVDRVDGPVWSKTLKGAGDAIVAEEIMESRDLPGTEVLAETRLTREFGGGTVEVTKTIDGPGQQPDEGAYVTQSSVKKIRGSLNLEQKETEQLAESSGAELILTNGGTGYSSDPTVSFSSGSSGTAATAAASLATAPTVGGVVELSYGFPGDNQGVFFYLGSYKRNGVWGNPQTAGQISLTAPFDTLELGTFASIVDRQPSNTYFVQRSRPELHIDLGTGRTLKLKKLAFRQRADFDSVCKAFGLQGSNDGTTWSAHAQNITVSKVASSWSVVAIDDAFAAYRYWRLIIPAGKDFLSVGELELYGTLTVPVEAGAVGVGSLRIVSPGTGYLTPPAVSFSGGGGSGASATAVVENGAVTRLVLVAPGTYATAPTVTIAPPGAAAGPTAVAHVAFGVASVSVGTPGSGYVSPPLVTFDGDGNGAAGYAVLSRGIASIGIVNPGSGYTSDPTISFIGGGGTGATAVVVRSYTIASVTVTAGGSGYTSPPTITPSSGDASFRALIGFGLSSIPISAGGSGYTSAPTVTVTGGTTNATATATLGKQVASITVDNSGTGYSSAPDVVISGGSGNGATASARLLGFGVASVAIGAAGSGFTSAPSVSLSGGGGTGAAVAAKLRATAGTTIGAPGTLYTVGDILTVVGGTGTAATIQVSTVDGGGGILTFVVLSAGLYSVVPANPVAVTGGTGSGATFNLTWEVGELTVTAAGSGYTTAPTVLVAGGGGTGATGTAILTTSQVIAIDLLTSGEGYESVPTITISGGGGTGAAATAVLAASGSVKRVNLTTPGAGYTVPGVVAFSGGAGTGATAAGLLLSTGGTLASIQVINPGSGYTSAPTLAISGGGGGGATATANLAGSGAIESIEVTAPGTGFTLPPTVVITGGGGTGLELLAALENEAVLDSVVMTSAGEGYTTAPTVNLEGGGGTGATATAVLETTGPVYYLILLTAGGPYLTPPTVTISGGGGSGATAVYQLSIGWPTIVDESIDPKEGIVIITSKRVVPVATPRLLRTAALGFPEKQGIDKWRSLQIVSKVDLSTLPRESWLTTRRVGFPDEILSVRPLWDQSTAFSQSSDPAAIGIGQSGLHASGGTGSVHATASVHGSIIVTKVGGFRGAAIARVERQFFYGIPPEASVPRPTIIRPSSGTAVVVGGTNEAGLSGSTIAPPLNAAGHPAQIGDLMPGSTITNPIIYTGGYIPPAASGTNGAVSRRTQVVDINDVLTPGLARSAIFSAGQVSSVAGSPLSVLAQASGSFYVEIPASCPASIPMGMSVLYEVAVEKWRLGVWVRELVYLIAPGHCDADGTTPPEEDRGIYCEFTIRYRAGDGQAGQDVNPQTILLEAFGWGWGFSRQTNPGTSARAWAFADTYSGGYPVHYLDADIVGLDEYFVQIRAIGSEDNLTVDFTCTVNGVSVPGFTGVPNNNDPDPWTELYRLRVGRNGTTDPIDIDVIGMKVGNEGPGSSNLFSDGGSLADISPPYTTVGDHASISGDNRLVTLAVGGFADATEYLFP